FITIGHIIHETLHLLYKPYCKKDVVVGPWEVKAIRNKVESKLRKVYKSEIKNADLDSGKNKIVYEVMKKFLENFLQKEEKNSGFRVLLLEKDIKKVKVSFYLDGKPCSVKLGGTVDRMDKTEDNVFRIIDYKTGKVNSLKIDSPDQLRGEEAIKHKEVFQLLLYLYLLKHSGKYPGRFRLGVYPFKKMYDDLRYVEYQGSEFIDDELLDEFEQILKEIFKEMFDPKEAFSQTADEANCKHCPYMNICGRNVDTMF
ncbi:MAG: PD-(D/E)XK nuclease family protein, partial [bacterium]|nr:PD-(D/E)XK nuclease family protein [bacterium]